MENLLTIKDIFRIFEVVSSLKVNFSKSHFYGVRLCKAFLKGVSSVCILKWDILFLSTYGYQLGLTREWSVTGNLWLSW